MKWRVGRQVIYNGHEAVIALHSPRSWQILEGCYRMFSARAPPKDIRHCRATNARDHAKIMAALKGSEDLVNRKIRDRMEDTVQFVKALSWTRANSWDDYDSNRRIRLSDISPLRFCGNGCVIVSRTWGFCTVRCCDVFRCTLPIVWGLGAGCKFCTVYSKFM